MTGQVTMLLRAWSAGERGAAERALPFLYVELRRLARRLLRSERPTLAPQATELVHELWLRFLRQPGLRWQNRAQFLATAAHVMRQVLVDQARRRAARKRGAGVPHLPLDAAAALSSAPGLVELDLILAALARTHPRAACALKLACLGGLTEHESAQQLGVSEVTVRRDLRLARAFMRRELRTGRAAAGHCRLLTS
jgi:RNA polymerase sigma factor (TIGR02999 family)